MRGLGTVYWCNLKPSDTICGGIILYACMRHTFPQEKVDNIRGNQTSPDTSCRRAKSSYGGRMLDRTICLVGNIAASTLGVGHRFTIAGVEPRVDLGERPLTRNNCECAPNRSLQQRILWAPRQCVPWWPNTKWQSLLHQTERSRTQQIHGYFGDA